MARDRNGRDHKAAGRPDGGQYGEKAGQGSDDDLEVPTTAESVAPDEGWWASLEDDPEAAGPWWERKDRMTPELETMRRTVVEAHSRKEAADILDGLSELARCAVIRNLPFARKAAVADLAPTGNPTPPQWPPACLTRLMTPRRACSSDGPPRATSGPPPRWPSMEATGTGNGWPNPPWRSIRPCGRP